MKSLGSLLVLLGLGSFVLNYFNVELKLMSWVDEWGYVPGLAIRGAFVVVGLLLMWAGSRRHAER